MGDFWKSKRFKILLGVLVLLLAMMLQAAWNGGVPPVLAQAVGVVVTPVQRAAAFISDGVTSHLRRYLAADQLAQENQQLHDELRQLREQMVDYERYKRESETLRDYLGIREEHEDLELLPAAVVARDPNSRFGSFTIDKGTLAGVEPLDPVISADGLVGLVREAGPNYAKVLTILDVEIDAGARCCAPRSWAPSRGMWSWPARAAASSATWTGRAPPPQGTWCTPPGGRCSPPTWWWAPSCGWRTSGRGSAGSRWCARRPRSRSSPT